MEGPNQRQALNEIFLHVLWGLCYELLRVSDTILRVEPHLKPFFLLKNNLFSKSQVSVQVNFPFGGPFCLFRTRYKTSDLGWLLSFQ